MNPRSESSPPRAAVFAWGVLAILAVALSLFAYSIRECCVDDAFIGFQYIENLLGGHGFVFHAGQKPVEGVTNIGWLLLLAPLSAMVQPTVAAKGAGFALLLAALATTMLLGRNLAARMSRDEDRFGLTLIPMILLASSFEFIYFPLAGMETSLLAVILLLMAWVALRRPYGMALPLFGAFAFLVHPEAAAVYPLYAAFSWIRSVAGGQRRKLIVGNIVLVAAIGAMTAIRFIYFGDIVPNTFHSKPSGLRLAVQNGYGFLMGQNTNVAFPITGWLAIPVLLLGCRRLRRASPGTADMLAAICGAGLVFAVYSPPDWTDLPRYFAPYLPAALILLWAGLAEAVDGACLLATRAKSPPVLWNYAASSRGKYGLLSAVALLLALTCLFDTRTKMSRMETFPGYILAGKNLVGPARWMRDHLPAEATIATRRIGVLAYYSRLKVFDYTYGLPDAEVARLVGRRGERFDTPTDPGLAAVWQARAPEYFLENGDLLDRIISLAGGTREHFSIHGAEYRVIREFSIGCETKWVLARRF